MKKILGLIAVLLMAFVLVGCNVEKSKITITFNSNGGSVVEEQTVDLKNISDFKMPADPSKEGYIFDGWYIDQDLLTAFDISQLKENVTLFAKWVEGNGLSVEAKLTFNATEYYDDEKYETKMDANIKVLAEELEVEKIEDLKLQAIIELSMEGQKVKLDLITTGGIAYVSIPKEITGMDTEYKVSINLKTLLDLLMSEMEAGAGDTSLSMMGIIGEFIAAESLDEKLNIIESFILENSGLPAETVDEIMILVEDAYELLLTLIPETKVEGNVTSFEITNQDVNEFMDAVCDFVVENYDVLYGLFEEDYVEYEEFFEIEIGTCTYYISPNENYYYDEFGNEYTYADDVTETFGSINNFTNVYTPYFADGYYDATTWEKLNYYCHDYIEGNIYYLMDDYQIMFENEVCALADYLEEIELYNIFNPVYEDIFYNYYYDEYVNSNLEVLDYDEVKNLLLEEEIAMIKEELEMAKNLFDLNQCKLSVTENNGNVEKIEFNFDLTLKEVDYESEELTYVDNSNIDLDLEINIKKCNVEIAAPNASEYQDITNTIQ